MMKYIKDKEGVRDKQAGWAMPTISILQSYFIYRYIRIASSSSNCGTGSG